MILNVSEKMFYKYGYEATTFSKIAGKLDITCGAITYHFKNKHFIVTNLIDAYLKNLHEFVYDTLPNEGVNIYLHQSIVYIYLYRTVMSDERNISIFYHKDQMALWENLKVDKIKEIYVSIAKDFHKPFSDEDLYMCAIMDLGIRKRLYSEFINGNEMLTNIDKYCHYHIYTMGILSRIDMMTVSQNIELAFEFANQNEPPTSDLFH